MIGEISAKAKTTHHSKSLDTAVLDGCEEQPGGAVEQGEHPARDDDPPCPGHGADVLKTIVKEGGEKTCIGYFDNLMSSSILNLLCGNF